MKIILIVALFLNQNVNCDREGFFTVVGSNVIKVNKAYRVSVTYQGYLEENVLQIRIEKYHEDDQNAFSQNVTLIGDGVQDIDFNIKNQSSGYYQLTVNATPGVHKFQPFTIIQSIMKKCSVLIQTDKSTYKPSDTVKFRVLVVDEDTKPYKFEKTEIFITDGAGHRVKQFENPTEKFTQGVFQNEFLLSDSPVLGRWKITVKVDDEEQKEKTFDVGEYVLPTFEVTLDANPVANFKDDIIYAGIDAKYTFGKIAKGNATVTALLYSLYGSSENNKTFEVTKSIKVDGKTFIEFSLKDDFGVNPSTFKSRLLNVRLTVTFVDDLSGLKGTAKAEVDVYETPYKLKLHIDPLHFKPNQPIAARVDVNLHDRNIPVTDNYNPVKLKIEYFYDLSQEIHPENGTFEIVRERYKYYTKKMEAKLLNGRANFDVKTDENLSYIHLEVEYLDNEDHTFTFSRRADFHEYESDMTVSLVTERPSLNKNISIKVTTINNMDRLTFQIFGRANLIETKAVKFENTKEYILDFMPKKSMAPRCKIIVYYIAADRKIISSTLEVEIENELLSFVNVKLSTNSSDPGTNVTLTVNAHPNSYVGLLGVDQSVLLLKRGNDIDSETISQDLNEHGQFLKSMDNYLISFYHENFNIVGAVILTNAKPSYKNINRIAQQELPINKNEKVNVKIRKNFPETWIFDSFELGSSDSKEIIKTVPDTITSWVITGFSMDSENGLSLTRQPTKLNVFMPFFVTTNLPYSVKRGEVVSIPIVVYNYLESDQTTILTLFNNNQEFEFVEADDSVSRSTRELQTEKRKEIVVKSNEGASVSFIIRPLKTGSITIKVTAVAQMAGDGIERQLKVELEGVTQYFNDGVLIGLVKGKEFKKEIEIVIPQEAVSDSVKIEVSAVGDIMGTTIENLDHLINLPTGCGEQNMLKFVPNIVALDYLTSINKLSPNLSKRAKKYIESGYQNELNFKHDDGSYSAFGKSDKSGSTWLTAFVAKTYNQASKYVHIDANEIYEALNFLKNIQADDGSFSEVGAVFHQSMQGGSSKGVALTAYTLSTFLEVKQHSRKFQRTVKKALDYLRKNLDQIEDNYSLAIVSYVLQLAQHPVKDEILNKLKIKSSNTNGLRYWKREEDDRDDYPNSINIEMSSYVLLAFLEGNQPKEAIPIMKWLVTQRNENGGFQSTQDTVVGLKALSEFTAKIYSPNTDINISVQPKNSDPVSFHINSQESLLIQKSILPLDARHFEISAVGNGFSFLQISYSYNLIEAQKLPRFMLKLKVSPKSNKKFLNLKVCTKFIPEPKVVQSNMAIIEVNLPSGFAFGNEHMNEILKSDKVKKVETKNGKTVMMVYYNNIDSNETCEEFKAYRTHSVANQKPASVVVYDYYDNSRQARAFYNPPEISFCDICENDDDCLDTCESPILYPN